MKTNQLWTVSSGFGVAILCKLFLAPLCCTAAVMLTTLHSFTGREDGANPVGLLQADDGDFYGTTSDSNIATSSGPFGTVFRVTPEGAFTNLHAFSGADGKWPQAGLVQDAVGNFYGTTYRGGAVGWGTVFKITPVGEFSTLASMDGFPGDANSLLLPTKDGNFYTVGNFGGTSSLGTLFRIGMDGTVAVLWSFNGIEGFPGWFSNPLVQGSEGNFYGATQFGGPSFTGAYRNTGYGTLFKMTPDRMVTNWVEFGISNGAYPTALVLAGDGNLYGTTGRGGQASVERPDGYGTVFKVATNGVFNMLTTFGGTNGLGPISLMQARDGNLYGATESGGTYTNYGTIFRITPNGTLNSLLSFNGNNGATPQWSKAPLVQAADGSFYGTTYRGGSNGYGTIFRFQVIADPPRLDFQKLNNQLVLSWTNAGFNLQSAPLITGTFTNIPGATSPYTNSLTAPQKYFRLISN